jgi:hypothetical protein
MDKKEAVEHSQFAMSVAEIVRRTRGGGGGHLLKIKYALGGVTDLSTHIPLCDDPKRGSDDGSTVPFGTKGPHGCAAVAT